MKRILIFIMLLSLSAPNSFYRADRMRGAIQIPSSHKVFDDASYYVWNPIVIESGGTYYMFYARWLKSAGWANWATASEIALATADNPLGPFTHDSVILEKGTGGAWDDEAVYNPCVIQDGSNWRMYFMGAGGSNGRIGVATATSINGTYTKSGSNPIIDVGAGGAWDDSYTANPSAMLDGSTYKVWYNGGKVSSGDSNIGLATASTWDGTYTKDAGNPVIDFGAGADIEDPFVWIEGGLYKMAIIDRVGTYTPDLGVIWQQSADGVSWETPEHGIVAMETARFGSFSQAGEPYIIFDANGKRTYFYISLRNAGADTAQISVGEFLQ